MVGKQLATAISFLSNILNLKLYEQVGQLFYIFSKDQIIMPAINLIQEMLAYGSMETLCKLYHLSVLSVILHMFVFIYAVTWYHFLGRKALTKVTQARVYLLLQSASYP